MLVLLLVLKIGQPTIHARRVVRGLPHSVALRKTIEALATNDAAIRRVITMSAVPDVLEATSLIIPDRLEQRLARPRGDDVRTVLVTLAAALLGLRRTDRNVRHRGLLNAGRVVH